MNVSPVFIRQPTGSRPKIRFCQGCWLTLFMSRFSFALSLPSKGQTSTDWWPTTVFRFVFLFFSFSFSFSTCRMSSFRVRGQGRCKILSFGISFLFLVFFFFFSQPNMKKKKNNLYYVGLDATWICFDIFDRFFCHCEGFLFGDLWPLSTTSSRFYNIFNSFPPSKQKIKNTKPQVKRKKKVSLTAFSRFILLLLFSLLTCTHPNDWNNRKKKFELVIIPLASNNDNFLFCRTRPWKFYFLFIYLLFFPVSGADEQVNDLPKHFFLSFFFFFRYHETKISIVISFCFVFVFNRQNKKKMKLNRNA